MDAAEQHARAGARRLSWAESECAILDALDAFGVMAFAARVGQTKINRDGLRTQLIGLQRLLSDEVPSHERTP